ncbi:MAG: plasmid maintenance system killer protein [Trueperaceae bacterium]|nr:MAG: plasmid maintenance system killer protein [Trueperaceae bacterium]
MIESFADRATEDVFDGRDSKRARAACPRALWRVARRTLDLLNRASGLRDLAIPPGNRLERLQGDRSGRYSVRINEQYCVCFVWKDGCAFDVEITDYH